MNNTTVSEKWKYYTQIPELCKNTEGKIQAQDV